MKENRLTDKFPIGKRYKEFIISSELVKELHKSIFNETKDFILRVEE